MTEYFFSRNIVRISETAIELHEHIKGAEKHISAAHTRINKGNLLRLYCALFRLDIAKFKLSPINIKAVLAEISSESILHHVPHHPLGCKKLCCRRNFVRTQSLAALQAHCYLAPVRLVEVLVESAQNIGLVPYLTRQLSERPCCSADC